MYCFLSFLFTVCNNDVHLHLLNIEQAASASHAAVLSFPLLQGQKFRWVGLDADADLKITRAFEHQQRNPYLSYANAAQPCIKTS